MTTWVSFSDTLRAFIKGDMNPRSSDRYAFGCDRSHIIREDELVPMELTWFTNKRETRREGISPNEISSGLLEQWRDFEKILISADAEGRISYRIGSYPEYLENHVEAIWPGHDRVIV